ncbi:MAG: ABC transporter permease [Sarcina sp.]
MSFIRLVIANIKRFAKNPTILAFTIMVPIVAIVAFTGMFDSNNKQSLAVIDMDNTVISKELIEEISQSYDINIFSKKDELNLENTESKAILTINEGYEKNIKEGVIPSVELEELIDFEGNKSLAFNIEAFTRKKLKSSILKEDMENIINTTLTEEENIMKGVMAMMMLIYYCMLGTMMINDDILKLKQQNILKRSITTANESRKIIGAIFTSSCLFTTFTSLIAFAAIYKLGFLEGVNPINGLITIILANIIFVSTTIFVVRWFKDPKIVAPVSSITGVVIFLLGLLGIIIDIIPQNLAFLEVFAVLSPYYWMSKILLGEVLIGVIVMLLIGGAVFTAGSYRLKDFVQN